MDCLDQLQVSQQQLFQHQVEFNWLQQNIEHLVYYAHEQCHYPYPPTN